MLARATWEREKLAANFTEEIDCLLLPERQRAEREKKCPGASGADIPGASGADARPSREDPPCYMEQESLLYYGILRYKGEIPEMRPGGHAGLKGLLGNFPSCYTVPPVTVTVARGAWP